MVIINSSRQAAPLAVSICFILVVSISVTLRVWAKHLKKVSLALDDHLIFTAAVRDTLEACAVPIEYLTLQQIFVYGLITCDIIGMLQHSITFDDVTDKKGVTQGGVGRHVTQVIAIDGPGPLTVFAKVCAQALELSAVCTTKSHTESNFFRIWLPYRCCGLSVSCLPNFPSYHSM